MLRAAGFLFFSTITGELKTSLPPAGQIGEKTHTIITRVTEKLLLPK